MRRNSCGAWAWRLASLIGIEAPEIASNSVLIDKPDEFTDEPRLHLLIFPEKKERGAFLFNCFIWKSSRDPEGMPGTALIATDPINCGISLNLVDVRLRFDRAPTIEDGWISICDPIGSFASLKSSKFLGARSVGGQGFATPSAGIIGAHPAADLLSRALESEQLVAQVANSRILRFDLTAARSDLARFNELCTSLHDMNTPYEFVDQRPLRVNLSGERGGTFSSCVGILWCTLLKCHWGPFSSVDTTTSRVTAPTFRSR